MGVETPIREDVIKCEINGEIMEVGGASVFDESTSNEAICAMTEDAIMQEEADRKKENEEINRMIANGTFSG